MAAIAEADKMNFRTQIVDGKPRIFYDPIDDSSTKPRSKRNSRTFNGTNRQPDPRSKANQAVQFESKRQPAKLYMTMDEIADLVNAVKDNQKSDTSVATEPKALSPPRHRVEPVAPAVPNLDLVLEPPPLPASQHSPRDEALGKMADKKRQKWMREKAEIERMQMEIEYDQLKHQLSPRQKKNPSPQRSTFQYDFPPSTKKTTETSQPSKQNSFAYGSKQNGYPYEVSNGASEAPDTFKTRLMEKKQQQWNQENSDKMTYWDPFGRPGAGAPKQQDNQPRISQPPSTTAVPYRPPTQLYDNGLPGVPPTGRERVPAAMRTNIAFGNGRVQEDVATLKELERRQWLDDLHRQIEENKRKKYADQESERRQDFLRDNVHPLVQEAASRHQPAADNTPIAYPGHDYSRDAKATGPATQKRTGENIFGPTYDTPLDENNNSKVDSTHLHVGYDRQQAYRSGDARRDEAVNTVETTFRGDHGMPPNRRVLVDAYDDSDLPPRGPNGHRHGAQRNNSQRPGKKTNRVRSLDDDAHSRHAPTGSHHHQNCHNTEPASQQNTNRTDHRSVDIRHRPLWNYNQQKRVEYVPNSKRDPHYEKRQRLKQLELGNYDGVDDVQKKTCYNRWNSDGDIQQKPAHSRNPRSTVSKTAPYGNHKDESIMNLLKGQAKPPSQPPQEVYAQRYPPANQTRADEDYYPHRSSSVERYDNVGSYLRATEGGEPASVYSQPLETISRPTVLETNNTSRQYGTPATKQEHILNQLSTIKENIIRRQRELASPVNGIPN